MQGHLLLIITDGQDAWDTSSCICNGSFGGLNVSSPVADLFSLKSALVLHAVHRNSDETVRQNAVSCARLLHLGSCNQKRTLDCFCALLHVTLIACNCFVNV